MIGLSPFSPPQVIFATLKIIKFMEQIIKIENTYYKISDETPEIGEEYISKWCFNSSYDFQYFLSKNYNNEKENLEFPENTFIFKIIKKIKIVEKFGIFQTIMNQIQLWLKVVIFLINLISKH